MDDLIAILLAIASPEVKLEGITLTFGNTTLDYAHGNVMRLTHALQETARTIGFANKTLQQRVMGETDMLDVPVALGATKPIGGRMFTASYFHGRDGMSGVSFIEGDPFPRAQESKLFRTQPGEQPADELILSVLRKHPPGTVRIAAVAPLTNLAQAYLKDPETFRRVGLISVMGGALDVPGNTSPTAEFNFFADPWAAKVLLEDAVASGEPPLPIHLLPLDITSIHTVPYSTLVREEGDPAFQASPLVRLVSSFLRKPRSVTNSFAPEGEPFDASKYDLFQAHDPLAVAHAIFCDPADASSGWSTLPREFVVETDGRHTRGFCVVDRRNHGKTYAGRNKAEVEEEQGPTHEHALEAEPASKRTKTQDSGTPKGVGVPRIEMVTQTPGSAWLEDMILERMGLSPAVART